MHDPRVGRFLSVDAKVKEHPSESPYSAFRNSPIFYVDADGNEWVNSHTAKVKALEGKLEANPDDKRIMRNLASERNKEAKVAEYIKTIQENDISLYNYIENLQVQNRDGETINVEVSVSVNDYNANQNQAGKTPYSNSGDAVRYNSLEGGGGFKAPINKDGKIGFDIVLNGEFSFHDVTLSNEAGDVMFRMEFPAAARASGSDKGKSEEQYLKPGTAGDYSNRVQETYDKRKKSREGRDSNNNPYPLENEKTN